ncbi:MAG: hypothetical protein ACYC3G_00355 [Minisyncoccota bacterium]
MNLKIGDIVKVVSVECRHFSRQGQVVGFNLDNKENPVRIWFGKDCDSFLDWENRIKLSDKYAVVAPSEAEQIKDLRTRDFTESDLQKESEWSMKTLVERYFHNFYHSYCEPKNVFVAGERCCDVRGCDCLITQRIIFNIWGTVDFADVCERHAKEYHGKCMDSFPYKKASKSK